MSQDATYDDREILMLAFLCVKDIGNLVERVEILDKFALTDQQISTVCGSAVQSVRNARQKRKKGRAQATT